MAETDTRLKDELIEKRVGYQKRVADELDEVKGRVDRLHNFIEGPSYYEVHDGEKGMLVAQLNAMKTYYQCLQQRVAFHKSQS